MNWRIKKWTNSMKMESFLDYTFIIVVQIKP